MKRLRVLSLNRVCVKIVPATIHKLKHLRYLDLSHSEMEMLPDDEILTLVNLQVLFLHWYSKLRQLPQNIGKLSNLAYLGLDGCSSLSWIPAGIRKLTYLRELSLFVVTEMGVVESGKAAGLGEFKYLNNLGWKLRIKGLERVKNKSEANALNLKEKSHLRCLELRWSSTSSRGGRGNENDARSDHDRSILEELQPHGYIKKIDMEGYVGTSLPNSLFSSARNMVRINLSSCINLMSLPSLDPLVSLKVLWLFGLDSLEYMQSEMIPSSQSNNNDSQYLPSLERLEIWRCPNLIGWSTTKIQESPHLPLVSHLVINGCPKMASVPRFLVCFKYVGLSKISSELLREFGVSLSPPLSPAQARFDRLFLEDVRDLRVLPQELLSHLSPLQNLYLRCCDDITTIPPTILHHLPCLLELHIWGVDPFKMEDYSDNDDDDYDDYDVNRYMPLHILPSLRVLELLGVSKLVNLPEWLQHSSNLQRLEICRCQKLKCLPDWLTKLTALESMNVRKCKLLSERCGSNKAEDWPNIAHIPNITVDSTMIQKDGHYLEGGGGGATRRRKRRSIFTHPILEVVDELCWETDLQSIPEMFSILLSHVTLPLHLAILALTY
ncbi:Disease resistance protein RGA2 [Linum perenne]